MLSTGMTHVLVSTAQTSSQSCHQITVNYVLMLICQALQCKKQQLSMLQAFALSISNCATRNPPVVQSHSYAADAAPPFSAFACRADAVTDLDEGAAPSDPTQGPAEGQAEAPSDRQSGAQLEPAEPKETEDPSAFLRKEGEAADVYARRIFERVYGHDIERVLRMEVHVTLPCSSTSA